jgi:ketosteroid isomerase-like protein
VSVRGKWHKQIQHEEESIHAGMGEFMAKRIVSIGLLLILAGGFLAAQRNVPVSADESKIQALESAWNLAEEEKNISALDQMLAATFVYTEFDGSFSDKSQFLKGIKTSSISSDQITNQEVSVRLYGDSAVVTGIFKEKGVENGKPFARRGRFTDTWVNQNGIWLCVASQATLLSH